MAFLTITIFIVTAIGFVFAVIGLVKQCRDDRNIKHMQIRLVLNPLLPGAEEIVSILTLLEEVKEGKLTLEELLTQEPEDVVVVVLFYQIRKLSEDLRFLNQELSQATQATGRFHTYSVESRQAAQRGLRDSIQDVTQELEKLRQKVRESALNV